MSNSTHEERRRPTVAFRSRFHGEGGYTLAEIAVALALLVGVLIPTVAGLVYVVAQDRVALEMEALRLAQSSLEEGLAELDLTKRPTSVSLPQAVTTSVTGWRIVRDVRRVGELRVIRVRVFRHAKTTPTITLQTARLYQPSSPNEVPR